MPPKKAKKAKKGQRAKTKHQANRSKDELRDEDLEHVAGGIGMPSDGMDAGASAKSSSSDSCLPPTDGDVQTSQLKPAELGTLPLASPRPGLPRVP